MDGQFFKGFFFFLRADQTVGSTCTKAAEAQEHMACNK